MKTRTWLLLFAGILLLSFIIALLLPHLAPHGTIAEIYQDGVLLQKIDLQTVTEAYSFTISNHQGNNTIFVSPNQIAVQDANCPDRLCVKQGPVQTTAYPIVCLPHGLVIRLVTHSHQAPDGITH